MQSILHTIPPSIPLWPYGDLLAPGGLSWSMKFINGTWRSKNFAARNGIIIGWGIDPQQGFQRDFFVGFHRDFIGIS